MGSESHDFACSLPSSTDTDMRGHGFLGGQDEMGVCVYTVGRGGLRVQQRHASLRGLFSKASAVSPQPGFQGHKESEITSKIGP